MQFAPSTRHKTDSEAVIHRLYGISSRHDAGFEQQLQELLQMGLERFRMDIGIVACIDEDLYEVVAAVAPEGVHIDRGVQVPLSETCCSITVHADGPVAFERAGATGFANHPVDEIGRLEAYIGVPIHRGAQFYGTLSFCSQTPRAGGFTAAELDSLTLMGSWLSNELARRHAESELDLLRGKLEGLERNDPLTDMLNRRGVRESFERHAERCGFEGSTLACVLIDIDDFSAVNHSLGHAAGDRVLCEVARRLRASLRPSDVAGRIGGDEFLAVLPNATLSDAKLVAERIAAAVRSEPVQVDGQAISVTVSIGAARLPPGVTTISEALTLAHDLVQESKRGGKDAVTVSMRVG